MECKGIREKLSAYLEGMNSPEERRLIEEHLHSCEICRQDLEDLRKAGERVRGLEEVEPPPGMTKKIMSRIREEEAGKRGILQKLFYPLPVKIPLEAVAMVFIAVIAVYVFRAVEPELKSVPLPPGTEKFALKSEVPQQAQRPKAVAPPPKDRASSQGMIQPEQKIGSARDEGEEATAFRMEEKRSDRELKEEAPSPAGRQSPPVEQTVPAKEKEAVADNTEAATAGRGVRESAENKAQLEATPAKKLSRELAEPNEIRVIVGDLKNASREVEALLAQVGARRINRETHERTVIFTALLQPEKMEGLRDQLVQLGEVQEKGNPSASLTEEVWIRLEIEASH